MVGIHMQQPNDHVNHTVHIVHCPDNVVVDWEILIGHMVCVVVAVFCPCMKYFFPTHSDAKDAALDWLTQG